MINDTLRRILELQKQYSAENTSAMQERGLLIRNGIPNWVRSNIESIQPSDRIDDLSVEGQDAIGRKSRIPYVRIFSKSKSPRAPHGWYIVFLFGLDGDSAYVTLGHGSTEPSLSPSGKMSFRDKSPEEMQRLVDWGKSQLPEKGIIDTRLTADINLGSAKGTLGSAYERTTLFAFRYHIGNLPTDEQLISDLQKLSTQLKVLYMAEENDPTMPGSIPPEIEDVEIAINAAAGKKQILRRSGQGFGLTFKENKVIEDHAVRSAIAHFKAQGWTTIEDVGATRSYDLHCTRGDEVLHVEVKGTTSHGETVLLTLNEVLLHKEKFPHNSLYVLSRIFLTRGDNPVAENGVPIVIQPWGVADEDLKPISYYYNVNQT